MPSARMKEETTPLPRLRGEAISFPPTRPSDRFQIRTFNLIKSDPFRAFFIAKGNQNIVIKNRD